MSHSISHSISHPKSSVYEYIAQNKNNVGKIKIDNTRFKLINHYGQCYYQCIIKCTFGNNRHDFLSKMYSEKKSAERDSFTKLLNHIKKISNNNNINNN